MTAHDVDRIARAVLLDFGLSHKLRRVALASGDWELEFASPGKPSIRVTTPDGPAHLIRRALMAALDVDG
jgi:hypothetical protein